MKRELKSVECKIEKQVEVPHSFSTSPCDFLAQKARDHNLCYLLAHADDGLIWGRTENGTLHTSHGIDPEVSPPLRAETLQQCRLFGEPGEFLLWRDDSAWRARLILDGQGEPVDAFDEDHILWGTQALKTHDGFTLVKEGRQGFLHAVPLVVENDMFKGNKHPLRLAIRHYLAYDNDGLARVALSRLINVHVQA